MQKRSFTVKYILSAYRREPFYIINMNLFLMLIFAAAVVVFGIEAFDNSGIITLINFSISFYIYN